MNQIKVALLATFVFCAGAVAQTSITTDSLDASKLYAICNHKVAGTPTAKDLSDLDTICVSYFRGLTDGLFMMQSMFDAKMRTCLPTQTAIDVKDAQQAFRAYIEKNPKFLKNSAGLVAAMSLIVANPCK